MILAQDGAGPANKLEEGLDSGVLDGAILSIKSRKPESMPKVVANLISKYPSSEFFLDTHFYASPIAMTSCGKIPDYHLYNSGLNRKDFSTKDINNYAHRLIDYQLGLGLTNVIIPSLTLGNFNDRFAMLSTQLYEESLSYLGEIKAVRQVKPYLSLVFNETALLDNENLSQYLDEITLYQNVAGFYIVVERPNNSLPQWQDSRTLAKLMYIINTLSINFEVVCGFTDFSGLMMLGSGAKHIASGWHQTLRQYTGRYFLKGGGKQNGTFRYPSKDLLTQIVSHPDLQSIIRMGTIPNMIDPQYGAGLIDPDNLQMSPTERVLLQWKSFRTLGDKIVNLDDKMSELQKMIILAETNLATLKQSGVILDKSSFSHYEVWKKAIDDFKNGVL